MYFLSLSHRKVFMKILFKLCKSSYQNKMIYQGNRMELGNIDSTFFVFTKSKAIVHYWNYLETKYYGEIKLATNSFYSYHGKVRLISSPWECVHFDQQTMVEMMMTEFLFPGFTRLAASISCLSNYSLLELYCLAVRSLKHLRRLCA